MARKKRIDNYGFLVVEVEDFEPGECPEHFRNEQAREYGCRHITRHWIFDLGWITVFCLTMVILGLALDGGR